MITQIQPGDLVLRDGRVEEVRYVGASDYSTEPDVWRPIVYATRIGSTREGWRIHAGDTRPEGVGAKDRVDAFYSWGYKNERIVGGCVSWGFVAAYRVVSRAEPAAPVTAETATGKTLADRDAEVRAVAAEMREIADATDACSGSNQRITDSTEFRAWADRLDPPQAQPLKVGDRVRILPSVTEFATIRAIFKEMALIERDDGSVFGHIIDKLERIP